MSERDRPLAGKMGSPVLVPPWTRRPCDECGCEHLATRSNAAPAPLLCETCDAFSRSARDLAAARERIAELEGDLDFAEKLNTQLADGRDERNNHARNARAIALLGSTWREALAVIEALGHVRTFRNDPTVLDEALRRLDDYHAAVRAHREASDGE